MEVGLEDLEETAADGGGSAGTHAVEDFADVGGSGDVVVGAGGGGCGGAAVIEEVDVDAVGVVLGADWGDGGNGLLGFGPAGAAHAGAVIDEEDCVKVFEE